MLAYFLLGFLYFSSRTQDTFTFTTTPRDVGSPRAAPLDGASNTVVFEVPSFEILSIGQALGVWVLGSCTKGINKQSH